MLLHIFDFTPAHAAIGGALLGSASVARMALTGRILGVSGIAGGLVRGSAREPQRWLFVGGLIASGLAMQQASLYPAFGRTEVAPWRELLAGLAVGLGAGLGNGCTSGHGITGNARFSKRSVVFTATFMVAGCAVATATHSASAVRVEHAPLPSAADSLVLAAQLLAGHVACYGAVAALATAGIVGRALALDALSLVDGSLFGCGLGISGMTSPARVAQFLDLSDGRWNPTLLFVMGGALAVVTPFMQLAVLRKGLATPLLAPKFGLPTATALDPKLAIGGVLFGSGWGLAGLCPGPALFGMASPFGPQLLFIGALGVGLRLADSAALAVWLGRREK